MRIQLLVDNPASWIMPFAQKLEKQLAKRGHFSSIVHEHNDVIEGDILCLLSCERIFRKLHLNKHNLVVHESALPQGKGWSPLTWQILEGKNEIPISLFEAEEKVDNGPIYFQEIMKFQGHELLRELKKAQGEKTIHLILKFVDNYPDVAGIPQHGEQTYYKRRGPKDSEININDTIASQFDLLRICDNERYPAWFVKDGYKYILKIEKIS